ncbi:MAG: serine hydroxymethyltransferase [Candidatus Aenigmatarchaeota archaeon]
MPDVFELIEKEKQRQITTLGMIPSENLASVDVLRACGSVLANKYAEGYPFKRYYQGNEIVDQIEQLAIELAEKLFGAEHANVQPNSGSPANMAVYNALLKPGDKIMSMDLMHGGHLTHGSKVNFSGKTYDIIHYGVETNGFLDMDKIRALAEETKPKLILSGYTAYPRTIDFKEFHDIAQSVGAYSFADISHIAGLCATGVHVSPTPDTDVVMTTTHKTLRGPRGAIILCKSQYASAIDKAVFPGLQGGPHENTIAAKAVAFQEAMKPEFKDYCEQIVKNAKTLANVLIENGLTLVSGGTDNHLMLIDLRPLGIDGKTGAVALEKAGIVVNANTIPYETGTPMKPSGIRLGTPLLTTRGMKEGEMKDIGIWVVDVLKDTGNAGKQENIRKDVLALCAKFPFY